MTFRISSLPPRDHGLETREAHAARPQEAAARSESAGNGDGAVVLDLTPQAIRRAVKPEAPAEDPAVMAAKLQEQARSNATRFMQAQGAPGAARVMALLFGN
ncbi:MAG: hypothetical protein FJZ01_27650 [Candidatus Sericytochromatia bacterium]|nr:hypothetical protein [Candidatus Tanganyikabacteria bacterium]